MTENVSADVNALYNALRGLADAEGRVRGIGARAIAYVAEIESPAAVTAAAIALAAECKIEFRPGRFKTAHGYQLRDLSARDSLTLQQRARARLHDYLRATRRKAHERAETTEKS
jgi:hypothetical protein